MQILQARLCAIFLAFVIAGFLSVDGSAGARERAASFSLKDQNGKTLNVSFPRGKPSIILFGDRKGAEQLEGWIRPIYNRYGNRVEIQGVADLTGVPWLARPVVTAIIRRNTGYSVMLDWGGAVSKRYGSRKQQANVFVIDREGNVVGKQFGAANGDKLSQIYGRLDALFR